MTDRVIRIVLDSSGVRAGSRQVQQTLGGIDRTSRRTSQTLKTLARTAGLVVASLGVREIGQTISAYQGLQNRLRTVVDTEEDLISTQNRLADISRETRTGLESTTSLYQRATIAAGELGASQEQLFELVEITGKALAVQGGAASESAGALRQLSQSFSSGVVRAEEFNSILEGAFPIALAAARGLDEAAGSVGKLRNLVVEGEVTSREFFEAILEGGEGIEEQFANTEVTISQAFVVLRNSALLSIGRLNDATGAGEAFAGIVISIADNIDTFSRAITGSLRPTDNLTEEMEQLSIAAVVATTTLKSLLDLVLIIPSFGRDTTEFLAGITAGLVEFDKGLSQGIRNAFGADFEVRDNFEQAGRIFSEVFSDGLDDSQESAADFLENLVENAQSASDRISQILLPAFRPEVDEDTAGGDEGAAPVDTIDPKVLEDQQDFIAGLQQQAVELGIQTSLLDDAESTLLRYTVAVEAATLGDAAFVDKALEAADAINAQAEALAQAQDRAEDSDLIDSLQTELELLGLSNRERAIEIQLRELSAEATDAQKDSVRALVGAIFDQEEALRNQTDFLEDIAQRAAENIQDAFADFLFDPFEDGLDGLVSSFADALRQMASQALAQEIFGALFEEGSGGLGDFFSSFLGGTRARGGGVQADQSFIVGERGPEIFTPPTAGSITPAASSAAMSPNVSVPVQVINVRDPSEIPAAMQSQAGQEVILNTIRENPDVVRQVS